MKKPHAKRLTAKELTFLKEIMRMWSPHQVSHIAKLMHHIAWQDGEIVKLEGHLSELRQKHFFKDQEAIEKRLPPSEHTPPPIRAEKQCSPLPMRLATMERGSREWDLTLKFSQLTEAQADLLINEYTLTKSSTDSSS